LCLKWRGSTGDIHAKLTGGGVINSYIAGQRERFGKEMAANPELRLRMAAMLQTEGSGTMAAESAFNRAGFCRIARALLGRFTKRCSFS
jgi:hypothetical protein